jgi:hypothetical protein
MSAYVYEFENFGLSDGHFHLLRNRYCYKKYEFKEIDSIKLKKGRSVNNWLIMLIIGIIFIVVPVIFYAIVFILISDLGFTPTAKRAKVDGMILLSPLFISFMGVLLIKQSLNSCLILEVRSNSFRNNCWLPKHMNRNDIDVLVKFLKQKCAGKVEVDVIL